MLTRIHIDNIGKGIDRSLFSGSNENTFETLVTKKFIKALKGGKIIPKYDLVFIFFNWKEYGLKRSNYYITNPKFSSNKTPLNANLDYLEREKYLCIMFYIYSYNSENFTNLSRGINKNLLIFLSDYNLITKSDHYRFVSLEKLPTLLTRANDDLSMLYLYNRKIAVHKKITYQKSIQSDRLNNKI